MGFPCWNTRNRPWLCNRTQESRMRRIRTTSLVFARCSIAAGLLVIGAAIRCRADLPVVGRQSQRRDRCARARSSLVARLPARWPHAGHRAARTPAHRQQGRQAVAAGRRRAEGRARPARAACSTSCSTATIAQNQTIYFCFADPVNGGSRTALASARLIDEGAPRLDDVKVIFRQEGPLSQRHAFRLPHRADAATTICS